MGFKKKLAGSAVTAMLLCSALAPSVFAVEGDIYAGTNGVLSIEKTLEVTGSGDMAPNETFTFKIEPFEKEIGQRVDGLEIRKGKELQGADNIASKAFSNADKATMQDGKKIIVDKTASFDFKNAGFPKEAAIYRYKVTENAGANTGIVTYDTGAYQLDVYVNNDGEVTALVAKKLNGQQDATVGDKAPIKFENAYDTEDLTVEKTVSGTTGEQKRDFTFVLNVKESNCLANGTVIAATKHKQDQKTETVNVTVGQDTEFTLKHNEKLVLSNLPKETDYTLTEKEANQDGYTTTSTATVSVKKDDNGNFTVKDGSNKVAFANARDGVTPTGILLNVAPYAAAFLLAAAAVVFFIARKKRKYQA